MPTSTELINARLDGLEAQVQYLTESLFALRDQLATLTLQALNENVQLRTELSQLLAPTQKFNA